MPDTTSIATSGRVENVNGYFIAVHKTIGPAGYLMTALTRLQLDARSPAMTRRIYSAISKLSGATFRLAQPTGGLLLQVYGLRTYMKTF